MQQRTPTEEFASGPQAAWLDFDARLARGPLQVRPLWSEAQTRNLARQVLNRRRSKLLLRLTAGFVCACLAVYVLATRG